jgi:hypothetical protein
MQNSHSDSCPLPPAFVHRSLHAPNFMIRNTTLQLLEIFADFGR